MAAVARPFVWFYHEFGLASVNQTGSNAWLIIVARAMRMFAYGTTALMLALFFKEIGFSDVRIGTFMTLTQFGDVFLGTFLTLVADRVGRRKIMLAGSFLMIFTGVIFATFQNFWILLFAAIVGVVSATGGDFGPFRSIEESIISQLTTPTTRADVLSWYITLSAVGSTLGSELSGRTIDYLRQHNGWRLVDAYHYIFWIYVVMGLVNAALVLLLSPACEAAAQAQQQETYDQVPQDDSEDTSIELVDEQPDRTSTPLQPQPPTPPPSPKHWYTSLFRWMGPISQPTLVTMSKLWVLLSIDSLSDGMVPYSLTNYYMDHKFRPSKSTLGDVTSVAYILSAIGGVFAGPLARKIGLVNTMVFTHIPSSAAVLVFPWPSVFWLTAMLLFVRSGLNNMDQAPRTALIAAVVRPEERTAIMGITSMIRTGASTVGPLVTGFLAGSDMFWLAFVMGGACRLTYDVGLWVIFVNVKLHQHEQEHQPKEEMRQVQQRDEEEEMGSLADEDEEVESGKAFDEEGRRK